MSLVVWLPWDKWHVPVTSPGVVALAGAICLIIIVRKEEKIVQSIDLQTLLFIAAYRYTTQVCVIRSQQRSELYFNFCDTKPGQTADRFDYHVSHFLLS